MNEDPEENKETEENPGDTQEESAEPGEDQSEEDTESGEDGENGEFDSAESQSVDLVKIGKKYEVYPTKALPEYDRGEIKAYKAKDTSSDEDLIALVCVKHLTPRMRSIQVYSSIINPHLATLEGKAIAFWPLTQQQHFVLLYKANWGKPLQEQGTRNAVGLKPDTMEALLPNILGAVLDLQTKDFVHGAIRATNIYDGGGANGEKIILGDALAAPASALQSALYEPVTRAMADPIARGKGTLADDMYALGVALAVLGRTTDPYEDSAEEDVVAQKIESGSYAAVTGKDRFGGQLQELLRGLLHDDPEHRWGIEEVLAWLDGRRLSPKQAARQKKAARPFVMEGKKYSHVAVLAMDLQKHPEEAANVVNNESLEQWISRSMEDQDTIERLQSALETSKQGAGSGISKLLSYVSMALHPSAPMRYKKLKLLGDGIGTALTKAAVLGEDLQVYSEIFSFGISMYWVNLQESANVDRTSLVTKFDSCRNFIRQGEKMGYGIERCLYFLNQEAPCLSKNIKNYYAATPEGLLYAFEDLCKKGKAPHLFLDRHVVAFLQVHDRSVISPFMFDLNEAEEYKKILSNIKCLAAIQQRGNLPNKFKNLSKHFVDLLPAVYARYHDAEVYKKLEKNMDGLAKKGDLVKMAGILDNSEVIERDRLNFFKAFREYRDLSNEYKKLDNSLTKSRMFGVAAGRDAAAAVSCVLSVFIILFVILTGI